MEQMAFDVTAPEIANVIAQDLADAQTLAPAGVQVQALIQFNGRVLPF